MPRWRMRGWSDVTGWRAALAAVLALAATPASAQRFVSLDYKIGGDSDYVVLVDLNAVRRGGDLSDVLATVEHVEPFIGSNGRPATRRWLRMQFNCATYELRVLPLESATAPGASLLGAGPVDNAAPSPVPPGSEIDRAMCSQQGVRSHWPLLNVSLMEGPDTRKPVYPDAMRFPWPTLESAVESFVRIRTRDAMVKARGEVPATEPKRVANLPYPAPGLVFTRLRLRYNDGPVGLHLVEQAFVDVGSAVQIAPDTYVFTALGIARTSQSANTPRHPQVEVAIEVRCKPQPVQRYINLDTNVGDLVKVTPLPGALMRWSPDLLPFSKGLCTGQFDTTAKTHTALAPAMAELTATVQAAARQ